MTLRRQYTIINPQDTGDLVNQINTILARMATEIPKDLWPVGRIFITTSAENPADLVGFGEWESIDATTFGISTDYYVWERTA